MSTKHRVDAYEATVFKTGYSDTVLCVLKQWVSVLSKLYFCGSNWSFAFEIYFQAESRKLWNWNCHFHQSQSFWWKFPPINQSFSRISDSDEEEMNYRNIPSCFPGFKFNFISRKKSEEQWQMAQKQNINNHFWFVRPKLFWLSLFLPVPGSGFKPSALRFLVKCSTPWHSLLLVKWSKFQTTVNYLVIKKHKYLPGIRLKANEYNPKEFLLKGKDQYNWPPCTD